MRLEFDTYTEVADSLLRNKSRSILTGFGIFWGLFMLLFLLGGGKGLKNQLMKNFDGFASNAVVLFSDVTSKPYKGFQEQRYWEMTTKDMERLRMMVPELDIITPTMSAWGQTAVYGTKSVGAIIKGADQNYSKVESPYLKYGRFINQIDNAQERKVCVIGKEIYETLFPQGGDPCGQFIKAGSVYFQIIGVDVAGGNIQINGRVSESIIIPFSLAQKLYNKGDNVDLIMLTVKQGYKASEIEPKIRAVMGREHYFDATDKQALHVMNFEEIFAVIDNLFSGLNILFWIIGIGTLLAGLIGVSNIMTVSVKERTVEIGIRRAIGASPSDILGQIIMESISLTLVAGSAGIVFSVWVLSAMEKGIGDPSFSVSFTAAVLAASALVFLGVAAGLAPALKAMKVKPVDAMRDE